MCWVNVVSTRRADDRFKLNLNVAQAINETPSEYEVFYAGDVSPYKVEKTPEMVEAVNSLVPVKSQPVVPAESEDDPSALDDVAVQGPFRITGLGLYETASCEQVHVVSNDGSDPETNAPWFSPQHGWYKQSGVSLTFNPKHHIVKLIKLDEVQGLKQAAEEKQRLKVEEYHKRRREEYEKLKKEFEGGST